VPDFDGGRLRQPGNAGKERDMNAAVIRLGLIGDKITASRSPALHHTAGELVGLKVQYDLLVPAEFRLGFDGLLDHCIASGYQGVNVTYPYKELACRRSQRVSDAVRLMGAANTLRFRNGNIIGHNTDYSGFVAAYRRRFADAPPGAVAVIGAGGVGKAVAFALQSLGASSVRLYDLIAERAADLAQALNTSQPQPRAQAAASLAECLAGASGIANCTPVGMVDHPGTPVPRTLLSGATWAFEAVYTPLNTEFLRDTNASGLRTFNGYELLFSQGIDAFECFTDRRPDERALRHRLNVLYGY
jgi:shikimate dehydrogenase